MIEIVEAKASDYKLLSSISVQTFIEAYQNNIDIAYLNAYTTTELSPEATKEELHNSKIKYHFIYQNNQIAGYSKIVIDSENSEIKEQNITKLDKLYLLNNFYGKSLGVELLNFNLKLSKKYRQKGVWLYVWEENYKAVSFYQKANFNIVGKYNFNLSETQSYPNHIMHLAF